MTEESILLLLQQLGLTNRVDTLPRGRLALHFRRVLDAYARALIEVGGPQMFPGLEVARNVIAEAAGFFNYPSFCQVMARMLSVRIGGEETSPVFSSLGFAWALLIDASTARGHRRAAHALRELVGRIATSAELADAKALLVVERALRCNFAPLEQELLLGTAKGSASTESIRCFTYGMFLPRFALERVAGLTLEQDEKLFLELRTLVDEATTALGDAMTTRNGRYISDQGEVFENDGLVGHLEEVPPESRVGRVPQGVDQGCLDALLLGQEEISNLVCWARRSIDFAQQYCVALPLSMSVCLYGDAPGWVSKEGRLSSKLEASR